MKLLDRKKANPYSVANWPIVRPHKSKGAEYKVELPDKSAAEFWPILNKKGQTLKKLFPTSYALYF
jgi:hypothetical protein